MLKYYNQLGIFKNKSGTCSWDGVTGMSFDNCVVKLIDGVYYTANGWDNGRTGGNNFRELHNLIGEDFTILPMHHIGSIEEIIKTVDKRIEFEQYSHNSYEDGHFLKTQLLKTVEELKRVKEKIVASKKKEVGNEHC